MIGYYLKTAFRYLRKDKLYTFINLSGLSIGLACCFVILLFVFFELSFDRFHKSAGSIYRLTTQEHKEGATRKYAHSFMPFAPVLRTQFPEMGEIVRLLPYNTAVTNKAKNISFQEAKVFFVDSNFLKLFSFRLAKGDALTALNEPGNILITAVVAKRYFGEEEPMGKELALNKSAVFKIAGVFENLPSASSIDFDILIPMSNAKTLIGPWVEGGKSWYHPPVYTFLHMSESAVSQFNAGLSSVEKKFMPHEIATFRTHTLQPLRDVHFSALENELQPGTSKSVLYIFITVAILILVIAVFNFINLFLSRLLRRLRSVGIRKVVGAGNRHIWGQTLVEALSYLLVALLSATALTSLFLPLFNNTLGIHLHLSDAGYSGWITMALLTIFTGVVIAALPGMLFSRFNVLQIFKGEHTVLPSKSKSFSLQAFLVVLQFVIAVVLIITTFTVHSQMAFIRNKNLGFKKEHMLIIPVLEENVQNNLAAVKAELEKVNGVTGVSAISNLPWAKGFYDFNTTINNHGRLIESNAHTLLVEADFVSTMGMKMQSGRAFRKDFGTDATTAFIINETAAKKFGIDSYQGVKLTMQDVASGGPKEGELIGIVNDFHLESLHNQVQPLILTISPEPYYLDNIVVNLSSHSVAPALRQLEATFKRLNPNEPFDFFFLDEAIDKLYKKEIRLASLFNYFSILAVVVSCLGLFGISAFAAAQRVREIGIRKVLGASVTSLVVLLSKGLLILVLIGVLVAFPIAWWVMHNWLQDFAYRISIHWWVFAVAGCAALLIAWVTIGVQAIKAAVANPVKSLRTE